MTTKTKGGPKAPRTGAQRIRDQRQRDAAALDAFTQAIRDNWITTESGEGERLYIPYVANWREMMIFIREQFGKDETK